MSRLEVLRVVERKAAAPAVVSAATRGQQGRRIGAEHLCALEAAHVP